MIIRTTRRRTNRSTLPHNNHSGTDDGTTNEAPGDDPNATDSSDDADSHAAQQDAADPHNDSNDNDDDNEDTPELWVEYIQRATRSAEQLMQHHQVANWETVRRQKSWRMASRVAEHDPTRWTWRALHWQPGENPRQRGQRQQGGQRKRWEDDFVKFLKQNSPDQHPTPTPTTKGQPNDFTGIRTAQDTTTWSTLERQYAHPT
jgi:hypothetical protein